MRECFHLIARPVSSDAHDVAKDDRPEKKKHSKTNKNKKPEIIWSGRLFKPSENPWGAGPAMYCSVKCTKATPARAKPRSASTISKREGFCTFSIFLIFLVVFSAKVRYLSRFIGKSACILAKNPEKQIQRINRLVFLAGQRGLSVFEKKLPKRFENISETVEQQQNKRRFKQ